MISIDQIGIAIFGVLAVALSQSERYERRRWACIAGLFGQPFWFFAAIQAGQWGIFFVNILYCAAWANGLFVYWIRPPRLVFSMSRVNAAFKRQRRESTQEERLSSLRNHPGDTE